MSDKVFIRDMLDALLPPGGAVAPDEDLDLFLDGISEAIEEELLEKLALLASLRDANKTDILFDLEKEYGLVINTALIEQDRRERTAARQQNRFGYGKDYLQDKLQADGFDVQVHINNPPVDPASILQSSVSGVCGGSDSVCGSQNVGGDYLVVCAPPSL